MVILRIQELAEAKGLTLDELSQVSGVSLPAIQAYANAPVEITKETANEIIKIANKLDTPVIDLVKPINKRVAVKLRIIEMLKQKELTLDQLSDRSGIHPAILVFYSTQSIGEQVLAESPCQMHLNKVSEALGCCLEDLKVAAALPRTRLDIEEFLREKGLNLEDLSLLTELPSEFINLIATQPINISEFTKTTHFQNIGEKLCAICRCCIVDDDE